MATEFKKIGEVEQIESVSENTTVLVEEDGDIKRVSTNVLNLQYLDGVTSNIQEQLDTKASSWNDLTDKPFYEETKVVALLPEQSVIFDVEHDNIYAGSAEKKGIGSAFSIGKEYTVVVNGQSKNIIFDGRNILIDNLEIMVNSDDVRIIWSKEYGEPITLAIYAELEVVTPIDYKYMPEGYPKAETKRFEMPERSLTSEEQGNGFMSAYLSKTADAPAALRNTYIVYFNGTPYETKIHYDGWEYIIGNLHHWYPDVATDTGEPFLIADSGSCYYVVWREDYGETISIGISGEYEQIKLLDPFFGGRVSLRYNECEGDANDVIRKTFDGEDFTIGDYTEYLNRVGYNADIFVSITNSNYNSDMCKVVSYSTLTDTNGIVYATLTVVFNGQFRTMYIGDNPNSNSNSGPM